MLFGKRAEACLYCIFIYTIEVAILNAPPRERDGIIERINYMFSRRYSLSARARAFEACLLFFSPDKVKVFLKPFVSNKIFCGVLFARSLLYIYTSELFFSDTIFLPKEKSSFAIRTSIYNITLENSPAKTIHTCNFRRSLYNLVRGLHV